MALARWPSSWRRAFTYLSRTLTLSLAMPLYLPPVSRRKFLAGSLAAGWGCLNLAERSLAEEGPDADHWALISDLHINADPTKVVRDVNMYDNLRRVVGELGELSQRPAGLIVSGDCAHLMGRTGDYARLAELIEPLSSTGWPIHMMLGNHDDRSRMRHGFGRQLPEQPLVDGRLATILESRRANWFLLDSLDQVNATPGLIGSAQRRWLADALDARPDKPAIVVGHHNPRFDNPDHNSTGLLDTEELFAVLGPRKQVKAYIFGHTHHWGLAQYEGIHLVNLPPTAYLFVGPGGPNGWVDLRLEEQGARLTLHALDPKNPAASQVVDLRWRT